MKVKWLDRGVLMTPYLALCVTEDEYHATLKHRKFSGDIPSFTGSGHDGATTHILSDCHGSLVCLVNCHFETKDAAQVAALMAHEAVHVWKAQMDDIGEDCPGEEIEAYGIQNITQTLYAEAIRRGLADEPQG